MTTSHPKHSQLVYGWMASRDICLQKLGASNAFSPYILPAARKGEIGIAPNIHK